MTPPSTPNTDELGSSVGAVRFSGSLHNGDTDFHNVLAVGGGPGPACYASPFCGYFRAEMLDLSTGSLTTKTIDRSATDAGAFGWSVLGVDLVDDYHDPDRPGFGDYVGGGDELVVGDPEPRGGSGSDTGRIHWFYSEYSGSISDQGEVGTFDKYEWDEGGSFHPSAGSGAEFGTSLAARSSTYGTPTEAVAVGAPGENTVYVLKIDPAWTGTSGVTNGVEDTATPFSDTPSTLDTVGLSDLTDCTPTATVSRFGEEVLFHDLNGDDTPELIIGAPADRSGTTRGHVFILNGDTSFPYFDTSGCIVVVNGDGGINDEFGSSLAAGLITIDADHDHLVAGSPGHSVGGVPEAGGYCVIALDDDNPSTGDLRLDTSLFAPSGTNCFENPFPITSGDVQRFGESVAIGNFAILDRTGDPESKYATIEELAIGTPGGREVEMVGAAGGQGFEYQDTTGATAHGTVTVLRATDSGPLSLPPPGGTGGSGNAEDITQVIDPTAAAGDGIGTALFAANLQNNESPDLVIGAPGAGGSGDGEVYITQATPTSGLQTGLSGRYSVTDADGSNQARLMDFGVDGVSVAIEDFALEIEDTTNAKCTIDEDSDGTDEFTGRAVFDIYSAPADIASTDSSSPLSVTLDIPPADVGGIQDMTIDIDIWLQSGTGGTGTTIEYELHEPEIAGSDAWPSADCSAVPGNPNALDFITFQTCE